jgi:hypothetical protein
LVLGASPLSAYEVAVRALSFTSVVTNIGSVESCKWYDAAPVDAFQVSVGLGATPVAPFAGVDNAGTAGGDVGVIVVKLQEAEYALGPAALVALTRQ